jgi:plastocyanin
MSDVVGVASLWVFMVSAAAGLANAADAPTARHTYRVMIEGMQFNPHDLTVHHGDRIVWTNRDPFPHTVTADRKAFDSRSLSPEASWTYVAKRPGEYSYSCALHPMMKGKVIVQ